MNVNAKRHIVPTKDYLVQMDEFADGSDPRSQVYYFIEPYGPYAANEMSDVYYYAGNAVTYHEHHEGYETFLIDAGETEVISGSRKTIAKKGDMVHIQPYIPHMFRFLKDETIWRGLYQEIMMNPGMIRERRVRDHDNDLFVQKRWRTDDPTIWYEYKEPEATLVPPQMMPIVRPYDFSLASFTVNGCELRQKVGRHEYHGYKEIWQLLLDKGARLCWTGRNQYDLLYVVFSGSVDVKLDDGTSFAANERDLIHLPANMGGSITAREKTVLFDENCQGFLLRFMDEYNFVRARDPQKLLDEQFMQELSERWNYFIRFEKE